MGTQIHAGDNYRRVVELIQTGAIGPVREAHVWVSPDLGLAVAEEAAANTDIVYRARAADRQQIPCRRARLGPLARARAGPAVQPVYFPGPKWYRWWDFGNGTMSDLGSHWNDLPFWALKLDAPLTIEAVRPAAAPRDRPGVDARRLRVRPARRHAGRDAAWYQGEDKPELWQSRARSRSGATACCSSATRGCSSPTTRKHVLLPEKDFRDFSAAEPFIPKSLGHYAEWIHACKTGDADDLQLRLRRLAHRGQPPGQRRLPHRQEARVGRRQDACTATPPRPERFIRREYRKGWTLA